LRFGTTTIDEVVTKRDVSIAGPTVTLTATVDGDSNNSGGGLTLDQKIAIGVGAPTGILTMVGVFFTWRQLKRHR